MVWGRLDDRFHAHPKVAALNADPVTVPIMVAAVGLHALAISWCSDQLTDGFVPKSQPARLIGGSADELIAELLRVRLWDRHKDGYEIHDFLDWNPSKAQVLALSAARSDAGRRGANSRWNRGFDGNCYGKQIASAMANGRQTDSSGDGRAIAKRCPEPEPEPEPEPVPSTRIPNQEEPTSADAEVVDASPPPDDIDWDGTASSEPQTTLPIERISYKRIIEMWKATCPSLPAIIEIKDDRQKRTKQLFDLVGGYGGLEEFFKRVEASDFLAGRNPSKTHPNWRADYDFVTQRKTVIKILEGTHDNRRPAGMSKSTADMVALAKKWEEAENEGK